MAGICDLIIGKEDTPRLQLFRSSPTPEPGVALVLYRQGQSLITLWPGDRLTAGETRWGNYKTIYKVNVAECAFSFSCTLPCESDAFDFHAEVQVVCRVDDPRIIVERQLTDARSVLEPLIKNTMRSVSHNYDVEESTAAEQAITDMVREATYDVGIKITRLVVRLSLEEDARAHIRNLRQLERDKTRVVKEAELQKQRDELEMERLRLRMEFYGPLIKEGHWQLLALQLANHPEDVTTVAQMLQQQRQSEMVNQLKALKILLEEDALEGFQLEDASKRVLQRFVDSFGPEIETKALSSMSERKALAEGEGKTTRKRPARAKRPAKIPTKDIDEPAPDSSDTEVSSEE